MEKRDSSNFGDSVLNPSELVLSTQTKQEKIELRRNYRKLIEDTQNNKDEFIKPNNDGLMEHIARAEELFKDVQETREGALDSKFMSVAVTIGAQKTSLLQTDLVAFQPDEFVQKLITFMEGSVASDDADDVSIPESGWEKLGKTASTYFTSMVPAIHPLLGAFDTDSGPKKQRQAKRPDETTGKAQLPQHLTNYRVDQKEATPEEIERVFKIIKIIYAEDPSPIDYFELVTNPNSFGHTVENIFHLAFLVKDGLVKIFLNDNGIPVVEPVSSKDGRQRSQKQKEEPCNQVISRYLREDQTSLRQHALGSAVTRKVMVSLSMEEWQDIVDAYELSGKSPFIPPSVIGK